MHDTPSSRSTTTCYFQFNGVIVLLLRTTSTRSADDFVFFLSTAHPQGSVQCLATLVDYLKLSSYLTNYITTLIALHRYLLNHCRPYISASRRGYLQWSRRLYQNPQLRGARSNSRRDNHNDNPGFLRKSNIEYGPEDSDLGETESGKSIDRFKMESQWLLYSFIEKFPNIYKKDNLHVSFATWLVKYKTA